MKLTEGIARYVAEGAFDRVPPPAQEAAKHFVLDCIGVMAAGAWEPAAGVAARLVREEYGPGPCTVVAGGSSSPSGAALANGTAAHALDFDDTHHPGFLHPSAVLVRCLLAMSEQTRASGQAVIVAYVYGLDVMHALTSAINPSHYARGWHATATVGTVMASVAAGKLLELPAGELEAAIAIAGSQSAGLRCNFGSMTKPLHAGLAARNGVASAKLASQGFTATRGALEAEHGYLDLFAPDANWSTDTILGGLNHRFEAAVTGLAVKQYASCGATHPPIEALLTLRARHSLAPDDVAEIVCVINPLVTEILIHHRPATGLQGKFSLEYCLTVALVDGAAGSAQFFDARAADPAIRAVLERVTFKTDPTVGLAADMSWGARVMLRLTNGSEVCCDVDVAKGKWAGTRLSDAEIEAKFRACTASVGMPTDSAGEIAEMAAHLDSLDEAGDLMRPLAAVAPREVADLALRR